MQLPTTATAHVEGAQQLQPLGRMRGTPCGRCPRCIPEMRRTPRRQEKVARHAVAASERRTRHVTGRPGRNCLSVPPLRAGGRPAAGLHWHAGALPSKPPSGCPSCSRLGPPGLPGKPRAKRAEARLHGEAAAFASVPCGPCNSSWVFCWCVPAASCARRSARKAETNASRRQMPSIHIAEAQEMCPFLPTFPASSSRLIWAWRHSILAMSTRR